MAEQASHLSREAKGLQQGLKEALKIRDPWDKEIEFQRKNLRRQYLRLLLVHPYAKESKEAENHLWMQTSYAFISIYKQRLATLDRTLQSAPRHQPRQGGHGPVEYRKLMQRFRQFLAEEDKFWTQLVVRLRRSFGLDEAQSALVALGIMPVDETISAPNPESPGQAHHRDSGSAAGSRNQFQFPPEDSTSSAPPQSSAERADRLAILSKALVCLGDIARYRELYNESGGRPKAGHEDGSVPARKSSRGKRGGGPGMDPIPRARNYDKAQQCYEQARLLVPTEGNPSHQLAILSSYQKDVFGSLVHYYRALCVLQPYDTASENLGTVLNKALDQWKIKTRREKTAGKTAEIDGSSLAPRLRVENFKEKVVILHALWRLGVDKMESMSPKHAEGVLKDFTSLVSERVLPIDTISKVIVLAEGALWKHRTIRNSTPPAANFCPTTLESHIATHVLGLHRVLLEVGLHELAESQDAAENDLAQRITATFRRMLPALRIAGKWLRANFKYVLQGQQFGAAKDKQDPAKKDKRKGGVTITGMPLCWESYAQFTTALFRTFPVERLPSLTSPLEEDVDMKGFLPLKKLMVGEESGGAEGKEDVNKAAAQVHPNEEQLMRIADLLNDAKALIELENSPLVLRTNRFVAKVGGSVVQSPHVVYIGGQGDVVPHDSPSVDGGDLSNQSDSSDRDDDMMTEASRTDDDPVGDAFRQVIDGSHDDIDDGDDDEIVWNPRATTSPVASAIPSALPSPPRAIPMSPTAPSFTPKSPGRHSASSPLLAPAAPISSTSTTVLDLLNAMGLPRSSSGGDNSQLAPEKSSAPQPQLLFGSGPPNRPGHSIWSMSLDDSPPKYPNIAVGTQPIHPYDSSPHPIARSQGHPQPSWSSPSNHGSQNHVLEATPTHLVGTGSHHKTPSATNFFSPSQSPRHAALGYSQQSYYPGAPNSHISDAYIDPAIMAAGSLYPQTVYRGPPLHPHDPRVGQAYATAPVPQLWGNHG